MTIKQFKKKLDSLKKKFKYNPYEGRGRNTHCYLLYEHNGKDHKFDVRGWKLGADNILHISAVNWTLCAGSCVIELTEERIIEGNWRIQDVE